MPDITIDEVAKRLGISAADVDVLITRGILRPQLRDGNYFFASQDIDRLSARKNPTLSDEAAQVGVQIQQEVVSSVTSLQKLRKRASMLILASLLCLIIAITVLVFLFKFYPSQTSDFFGYYYRYNTSKSRVFLPGSESARIMAAAKAGETVKTSVIADLLKPIAATSLVAVKAVDSQRYQQIVTSPPLATNSPGPVGDQGPAGPAGVSGANGLQGLSGLPGLEGTKGDTGDTGVQGLQGSTGPQGIQGTVGLTGTQGLQGLQGVKGDVGHTGPQGSQGLVGPPGATGPAGPAGSTRVTGAPAVSASGAAANTQVSAAAACAAGKLLLGGGALITTTASAGRVVLSASYPSSTTVWTAVGTIIQNLGAGKTMSVTAYALCSQ